MNVTFWGIFSSLSQKNRIRETAAHVHVQINLFNGGVRLTPITKWGSFFYNPSFFGEKGRRVKENTHTIFVHTGLHSFKSLGAP